MQDELKSYAEQHGFQRKVSGYGFSKDIQEHGYQCRIELEYDHFLLVVTTYIYSSFGSLYNRNEYRSTQNNKFEFIGDIIRQQSKQIFNKMFNDFENKHLKNL